MLSKKLLSFLFAATMVATVLPSAHALWPFGGGNDDNDDVPLSQTADRDQAILPPDETYKERECEPLRLKAVQLNQTMASWNPWREIQVSRLKRKHRKCIRKFEEQQYAYLKQVTIGKQSAQHTTQAAE